MIIPSFLGVKLTADNELTLAASVYVKSCSNFPP
jgi:hypothetical protein